MGYSGVSNRLGPSAAPDSPVSIYPPAFAVLPCRGSGRVGTFLLNACTLLIQMRCPFKSMFSLLLIGACCPGVLLSPSAAAFMKFSCAILQYCCVCIASVMYNFQS